MVCKYLAKYFALLEIFYVYVPVYNCTRNIIPVTL